MSQLPEFLKDFLPYLWVVGAAGLASMIWVGFDRLEKVAEEGLRDQIRTWLKSESSGWENTLTQASGLLDRFFGQKHVSWRCFFLSALISVISFLGLTFLFFGDYIINDIGPIKTRIIYFIPLVFMIVMALNIIPDYFSLWESRVILRLMKGNFTIPRVTLLFALDLIISGVIILGWVGIVLFLIGMTQPEQAIKPGEILWGMILKGDFLHTPAQAMASFWGLGLLVWFCALLPLLTTYTTSVWVAIYVLAAFSIRFLSSIQFIKNLANKFFNIETQPIRTIGFMAWAGVWRKSPFNIISHKISPGLMACSG